MYIKDPETNKNIKVNNLDESIIQAKQFANYGDESDAFHKKQNAYWKEILKRLQELLPKTSYQFICTASDGVIIKCLNTNQIESYDFTGSLNDKISLKEFDKLKESLSFVETESVSFEDAYLKAKKYSTNDWSAFLNESLQ